MQICHVNLASGFSGGERQTLTLIKHQLELGYSLRVVAKEGSPFAKEIQTLCANSACELIETPHFLRRHAATITSDCQAVHVHEGRAVYWALIQHLRHGTPYIITRRIDNPMKKKALLKWAYARAFALVGLSSAIVDAIRLQHPDRDIHRIPSSPVAYPVEPEKVTAIRTRQANQLVIVQAAKMHAHKGFNLTIEAARLLHKVYPHMHFYLLGDGPEHAQLKEQAAGLPNVHFMGQQRDMGNWFAAADIFIHPAYSEGLGSVLLEASLAGCTIIAARAGGIPDIISHEDNGLLINAGESGQLVNALQVLAENPALRKRLAEQAQAKVAAFSIAETAPRYEALYRAAAQA